MPYDALMMDDISGFAGEAQQSGLSVFQVMPRGMYFGASRATSIDLCVRDLVMASRFRNMTTIIAQKVDDPFPDLRIEDLPAARYAATFTRANHVARAAFRRHPDMIIVQQHLPTAAAAAWRLPTAKVILHSHNFQKSYPTGPLKNQIRRAFKKGRYARLAGIIHVSDACARQFARDWSDVKIPRCVVNNGLDFAAWRLATKREKEILCVARCAPEKGVLEAALAIGEVLGEYPGWRTRFILSETFRHPDYFAKVRNVLAGLGGRAEIYVQRPFSEVKAACERAAIALVPSKWVEPFGRTALEAHAGGAALISSGTGGLAEISGDCALILSEVSSGAIASAIKTVIADESLRERLAREGAERVRACFDIGVQAARMDGFLRQIAGRTARLPSSKRPRTTRDAVFQSLQTGGSRGRRTP